VPEQVTDSCQRHSTIAPYSLTHLSETLYILKKRQRH